MRKKMYTILVLIAVMSTTGFVFAGEPLNNASSSSSKDHITKLNDYGIGEIIKNTKDKEVRDKLIEFWYTPAYTTDSIDAESPQAQRFCNRNDIGYVKNVHFRIRREN